MEHLKAVLADKIIDISSENGERSRIILEKLNRFRDFSFACESLMKKYSGIEDELIHMIQENDFDTRLASTRVNAIIEASEKGKSPDDTINNPIVREDSASENQDEWLPSETVSSDNPQNQNETLSTAEELSSSAINAGKIEPSISEENKPMSTAKRIGIVIAIIAVLVLGFYLIKFVIGNWKAILIVMGVLAIIAGLFWILTKKNNNETE